MPNYQIITDSGCDLSAEILQKRSVTMVSLTLLYKGQTLSDCVTDETKAFYDGLRSGEVASTSAINPDGWAAAMEGPLQTGKDVLVLTFSSGLSTTYQSAVIAANDLKEKFPGRSIRVVDTLCASLGQGLLVHYACQKRDPWARACWSITPAKSGTKAWIWTLLQTGWKKTSSTCATFSPWTT